MITKSKQIVRLFQNNYQVQRQISVFMLMQQQQHRTFSIFQQKDYQQWFIDNRFFDNNKNVKFHLSDNEKMSVKAHENGQGHNMRVTNEDLTQQLHQNTKCNATIDQMQIPIHQPQLHRLLRIHPDPVVVCADGGANRLFQLKDEQVKINAIVGDLDGLDIQTKNHYLQQGVKLVNKSYDQDTTDLHKALYYVSDHYNEKYKNHPNPPQESSHQQDQQQQSQISQVWHKHNPKVKCCEHGSICLVLGAFGGRMDHTMENLSTLHRFHFNPNHLVYFMNPESLIFKVPKGHTTIHFSEKFESKRHCGIVSISDAHVKTKGMEWNLGEGLWQTIGLESQISTSNVRCQDTIQIESDKDILYISEIKES